MRHPHIRIGDTIETEERCPHCGAYCDARCVDFDEDGALTLPVCPATTKCESCGERVHDDESVIVDGVTECRECHLRAMAEDAEAMDGDHETALASVYGDNS